MSATRALIHEIVVRSKDAEGKESDSVTRFDSSERQPTPEEVLEAAEKIKAEAADKEGFVAVMVRRTQVFTVYDQIDPKTMQETSTRTVLTTLV